MNLTMIGYTSLMYMSITHTACWYKSLYQVETVV